MACLSWSKHQSTNRWLLSAAVMRTETVDLGSESGSNIAVLGDAIPQLCVEHLYLEPAGGREGGKKS